MARNVINVNDHDVLKREAVAAGAITPGMLIARATTGKVAVHTVANGVAQLRIALENQLFGKGIDDAYAADDRVPYMIARSGDEFNGLIAEGQNVAISYKLISAGNGLFQKASPTETKASIVTGTSGAKNGITYTSVLYGYEGNGIEIKLVDPSGANQALAVSVTGKVITVSLATGSGSAISSTAALVVAALIASASASALVTPTLTSGNDGSVAVVAADVYTAGGVDGQGEDFLVEAQEAVNANAGVAARCLMVAR